jgi:galactonate dehydratase
MIQEVFQDYDVEWVEDLLENPVQIEDGRIQVPQGPGLGVELDLDAVADHLYTSGDDVEQINLFEKGWETRSLTDR